MPKEEGADAKVIAKLLKLDRSATWRRLSVARGDGYIVNMEQRRRMPGKYRVTGQEAEPIEILPKAEDLSAKFAHIPPEVVHSCNRDEIADISLRDNECKDECIPSAECAETSARVHTSASGLALVISLDGNGKLPPSARVHDFSGGTDAFPPVCVHCSAPATADSPVQLCAVAGEQLLLHRACQAEWLNETDDLAIPEFLRRAKDRAMEESSVMGKRRRFLLPAGLDREGRDKALQDLVMRHHKRGPQKNMISTGWIMDVYPGEHGWVNQPGNTDPKRKVYFAMVSKWKKPIEGDAR
jgi:hypothetical protein